MNVHNTTNQRSRVLISSADEAALGFMESALSALSQYEATTISLDSLLKEFAGLDPENFDLAIVDVGDGEVLENGGLADMRRRFSHMPVIFTSDQLSDERMRHLFLLDGSDWLRKPLERRSFVDSVNSHVQTVRSGGNLVHAVVSARGGAGATSVAITLASQLARQRKRVTPKTALFDLDFAAADCAAYLNIHNSYNIQDVLDNPTRVDLEFTDIVRKQHESGFSLFSFHKPELPLSPRADELILRMLDVVAFQNDHTILDVPYYETPWKENILASVNSVILVTDLSIPALQHAKELQARINRIRGGNRPARIVVNRAYGRTLFGSELGKKDIKRIFGSENFIIIPDDRDVMTKALNQGILPSEVNARSKFCSNVERVAESLRVLA